VILDCFCGRAVGTLIDHVQGNADVIATGNGACGGVRENPDVIPLKSAPSRRGS